MSGAATDRRLDLDAARAARAAERAAKGEPMVLVVGGEEFTLPEELPLDALNVFGALAEGNVGALELGLEALINGGLDVKGEVDEASGVTLPTTFERFKELAGSLSLDDAEWVIDAVCDSYGLEAPKSSASEPS